MLGLFSSTRWPAAGSSHEREVRRQLGDALVRGVGPGQRIAALVAVLAAMDLAHKVVDREGLPGRQLKSRAKEVAAGDWAASSG